MDDRDNPWAVLGALLIALGGMWLTAWAATAVTSPLGVIFTMLGGMAGTFTLTTVFWDNFRTRDDGTTHEGR